MKIKNRRQVLVAVTIAVVALFVSDRLLFEPLIQWWKTRETRVVKLRQEVNNGRMLVQREATIRGRWSQMRTNTLPADTSVAEQQVLKAFDGWSRDSGVSISSITPQWKSDTEDYTTLDCRVEASGDLGALSRFVYDVEKGPMALRLETLNLSTRDDTGQQLTLDLQVSGLVLTPQTQ
ncbi:MAG: type 4a pilus biogenesis protein PilO [Verrucomicrobiia bacterium]